MAIQPVRRVLDAPHGEGRAWDSSDLVEGRRDASRRRLAAEKIEALLRGQTVEFAEEDLNALLDAAMTAKGRTQGTKAMTLNAPNVRIQAGVVQLAAGLTINWLGLAPHFTLQARGSVVQESGRWIFAPSEIRIGALPLEKIPGAVDWVREQWLDPTKLYPDWRSAWARIGTVKVDGSRVRVALR